MTYKMWLNIQNKEPYLFKCICGHEQIPAEPLYDPALHGEHMEAPAEGKSKADGKGSTVGFDVLVHVSKKE